mgnify:CR=1 FL=1
MITYVKMGAAEKNVGLGVDLDSLDFGDECGSGVAQVDVVLQGKKVAVGHAEELREAERCVYGNFATVVENILNARDGNIDGRCEAVRGYAEWNEEFLAEDFAHRWRFDSVCHKSPLVVVHYLNAEEVAPAFGEADAPLVVYADAVLPLAVAVQCLKPVGRRNAKVFEPLCVVNHQQLAQHDLLNRVRKPSGKTLVVDKLGLGVRKTLYHRNNIHAKWVYRQETFRKNTKKYTF